MREKIKHYKNCIAGWILYYWTFVNKEQPTELVRNLSVWEIYERNIGWQNEKNDH